MYKVFIYDKPVFISNKSQFSGSFEQFSKDVKSNEIIEALKSEKVTGAEVVVDEPKKWFKEFKKQFKFIKAAGGTVFNSNKELLVIFRIGKWDLPKGKLEKGEDIPTCAVREVEEECAVDGLSIIRELDSTYHCYFHKEKWVLKRTYWFEMETAYDGKLVPQTEEGIEKVEWLKKEDYPKLKSNTYTSILEVIDAIE